MIIESLAQAAATGGKAGNGKATANSHWIGEIEGGCDKGSLFVPNFQCTKGSILSQSEVLCLHQQHR